MRPLDVSWGGLDNVGLHLVGGSLAFLVAYFLAPVAIRKLKGAGMVGRDRHKPDRPEVAEMGGVIVFAGFMAGAFAMLMLGSLTDRQDSLILATLILGSGAAMTGILDDFIALRQRFKAFLPLAFAAPLALFVEDSVIRFPLVGPVDFGLAYALVIVPLAIACAANSYNMLEGFNGLGAGMGLIMAVAISVLAWQGGDLTGLVITIPLGAALFAFLFYNWYPAQVFPGDTMTLFVGAMLASAGILSKVEFATGVLFLPFIAEFFLKARHHFPTVGWGGDLGEDGKLRAPLGQRPVGLAQAVLRLRGAASEVELVGVFYAVEAVLAIALLALQ